MSLQEANHRDAADEADDDDDGAVVGRLAIDPWRIPVSLWCLDIIK